MYRYEAGCQDIFIIITNSLGKVEAIKSIWQMKKLRLRKVKEIVQG